MLLALGLNIVVGWGGLLDLGYVAFFGIGAYTYALLSSDKYDIHLPTLVVIPLVAIVGGIVGLLVGLPSRRLSGDYLAIVTLFFFQVFLTFTNNGDDVFGHSLTNGPNGILNVDQFDIFGWTLPRATEDGLFDIVYLYVALVFFTVVYVALHLLNDSRTGRAWRSLREDPLAAELMGMPVNRLKLMAFAFGASVAALTGTFATALSGERVPAELRVPAPDHRLHDGHPGRRRQPGRRRDRRVVVSVLLEMLRDAGDDVRALFYVVIILALAAVFRASTKLALVLGGTIVFGLVARSRGGRDRRLLDRRAGRRNGSSRLAGWASDWVIVPPTSPGGSRRSRTSGSSRFCADPDARPRLGAHRPHRADALPRGLRLGERDAAAPGVGAYIVLGAILVATMIARPQGLLGEKRVEIVWWCPRCPPGSWRAMSGACVVLGRR